MQYYNNDEDQAVPAGDPAHDAGRSTEHPSVIVLPQSGDKAVSERAEDNEVYLLVFD